MNGFSNTQIDIFLLITTYIFHSNLIVTKQYVHKRADPYICAHTRTHSHPNTPIGTPLKKKNSGNIVAAAVKKHARTHWHLNAIITWQKKFSLYTKECSFCGKIFPISYPMDGSTDLEKLRFSF